MHFWTNIKIRFRQSFVKFVFSDKILGFFFISNTCIYFFQFANRKFLFWTVDIKSISSSDYSFKINKVSRKTPDFFSFHAYCVTMKKLWNVNTYICKLPKLMLMFITIYHFFFIYLHLFTSQFTNPDNSRVYNINTIKIIKYTETIKMAYVLMKFMKSL